MNTKIIYFSAIISLTWLPVTNLYADNLDANLAPSPQMLGVLHKDFQINRGKKREAVKEFMAITNVMKLGKDLTSQFISIYLDSLKKNVVNVPESAYSIVTEEIKNVFNTKLNSENKLYSQLYNLYDKYYSLTDLQNLIHFYKSKTGKKLLRMTPQITQESTHIAKEWGKMQIPEIQKRIQARLQQEGILKVKNKKDNL